MDSYPPMDPYPIQKLPWVELKGEAESDEKSVDDQRTINQSQFPSINDVSRLPSTKLAENERPPPILKKTVSEPESISDYEVGLNVNMKYLE